MAKSKKFPFVIDMHTHIRVQALFDIMEANPVQTPGPGTEDWYVGGSAMNTGTNLVARDRERWAVMTDPKQRLAAMDQQGVDVQVISVNFPTTCSWLEPELGLKAARLTNDTIAEFCATKPDRFVGVGVVPLQAPELAARELERCVTDLGLRGVWITSHIRAQDIGRRAIRPFWSAAERLDVPVFIHPLGPTDISRMRDNFLFNVVGQPLEETLSICSLIYEGVMDAYPRLKVGISHGGGYLPYYIGRSDWAYEHNRGGVRDRLKQKPSAYLSRFYYDTIIHDPDILPILVKKAGVGHVMMGSDWPAVSEDAIAFIADADFLSDDEKQKIIWKNASELFRIGACQRRRPPQRSADIVISGDHRT